MKHYSHIILTLAISAIIWPLQSCANSAPKPEAADPVESTVAESAEAHPNQEYHTTIKDINQSVRWTSWV